MLASKSETVSLAYSLFLHTHFFQSGIPPKKGVDGRNYEWGYATLKKKTGWRKREYASDTISGLLASTQNETRFIS